MSKRISYAITDNNITVNFDGQTHILPRSEALANDVISALREGRQQDIPWLVSAAKRVENYGQGAFQVKEGVIFVNGQAVHDVLSRKILSFLREKLPHLPLVKFAENLQKNPSYRAVTELFLFLEKNDHPITEEGNFIAYKRVRSDFKDIHSGTFDNSPGAEPAVPRNQVDEDCTRTCSNGLHVANWTYAHTQFASHNPGTDIMLEVEVNPADVVAIPIDYNNAKMRVCKYKVLGVVDRAHSSDVQLRQVAVPVFNDVVEDEDEDEDEVDDYSECEDCGVEIDSRDSLCWECEDDRVTEEEEEENEDKYPWEDEV